MSAGTAVCLLLQECALYNINQRVVSSRADSTKLHTQMAAGHARVQNAYQCNQKFIDNASDAKLQLF
eukprot:823180-Pelagomonas_calceolata.AAC.5